MFIAYLQILSIYLLKTASCIFLPAVLFYVRVSREIKLFTNLYKKRLRRKSLLTRFIVQISKPSIPSIRTYYLINFVSQGCFFLRPQKVKFQYLTIFFSCKGQVNKPQSNVNPIVIPKFNSHVKFQYCTMCRT